MMKNDEELVEEALGGEPQAFGPIVERYRDAVFGIALSRLNDFADAEDVAQTVFIEAYQSLGSLKDPSRLGPWLRQMAINRSIDVVRKRRDTEPIEMIAETRAAPQPGAGESLKDEILTAIGRLSKTYRETVMLFYMNGYTVAEVARMQDVPEGTVKGRLHDARKKLKDDMMDTIQQVLHEGAPGEEFQHRVMDLLNRRDKPPIPPWSREYKAIKPRLEEIGGRGIEGFEKAMQSPHSATRLFAAKLIMCAYKGNEERVITLMKKALADPNRKVRRWAFETLCHLEIGTARRSSELVPLFVPLLRDPSRTVRGRVAYVLHWPGEFPSLLPLEEVALALAEEKREGVRNDLKVLVKEMVNRRRSTTEDKVEVKPV
jgi:RNA polymerase sigma-70 factor, ECF subfamily